MTSQEPIDWQEWLTKAALTGAIATTAAYILSDTGNPIDFMGYSVPYVAVVGAGGAAASIVGDAAHKWVFPMIPHNEKYANVESAAFSVVAAGLGCYAATYLSGEPARLVPSLVLGGGAYLAADYLWENFLDRDSREFLF